MDRSLTLVLVDGHEPTRAALATGLQRQPGVRLLAAVGDASTAVPLITTLLPEVVLFEPKTMPEPAEAALARLLATGCPVVIWTSSLTDDEGVVFLQSGAIAVLLKEAHLEHLVEGLQSALASR